MAWLRNLRCADTRWEHCKIYDKERTICDLIRKRDSIDVIEFNYTLKAYVASEDKNLARLSEYAQALNVESRVWDAMRVLL